MPSALGPAAPDPVPGWAWVVAWAIAAVLFSLFAAGAVYALFYRQKPASRKQPASTPPESADEGAKNFTGGAPATRLIRFADETGGRLEDVVEIPARGDAAV